MKNKEEGDWGLKTLKDIFNKTQEMSPEEFKKIINEADCEYKRLRSAEDNKE